MKKKEHIIFDNTNVNEEDYREAFEEYCEMNGYEEGEKDLSEYVWETIDMYLQDEHSNLNKTINGNILVIADLGFWDGRRSGYKIIHTNNLNAIFNVLGGDYDYFKFYCDRYDVKAELHHHDGTHYLTFREIREGKDITSLTDKLYEQEEITQKEITRYTKSLKPYVKQIYGW